MHLCKIANLQACFIQALPPPNKNRTYMTHSDKGTDTTSNFQYLVIGEISQIINTNYHFLTRYQIVTITFPIYTHTRPRGTNFSEVSNDNIKGSQHQALDKRRQMTAILKGKIYQKQKVPCLMTSAENQKYNRKTSQVDRDPSLLLQANTTSRISEQQYLSCF